MQNPTGVWCFFNQKMKSPLGSQTFRVSGNAKSHRGLVFFYPKNEIPTGVSGIQGVRKCKTPPGSGVFSSKKWNPHRGLRLLGCWKVQNPTGVWCFFIQKMESPPGSWAFRVSGNARPHRGLVFFFQKIPTTPCSLLSQTLWKSEPSVETLF